ncbi:hypothetical protein A9Q93_05085 [Nonlabens dokdonensis]|uniref:Uncharacterized protein n=1 Tax=Nonlabens dokdonensis TaxID=328515 RepID=A0A1Z8B392_9FLAO|nr:hypothetical protein [Nonlabens dokdonensis]OUS17057.1 hypothetical protein A9Q93_05085 [Nonlabens dokdonensis]
MSIHTNSENSVLNPSVLGAVNYESLLSLQLPLVDASERTALDEAHIKQRPFRSCFIENDEDFEYVDYILQFNDSLSLTYYNGDEYARLSRVDKNDNTRISSMLIHDLETLDVMILMFRP